MYLRQADLAVANATNSRYEDAVELLIKAAALLRQKGRSQQFAQRLEALRTKFRAKRNFQKLLEQRAKSLE